MSSQPDHPNVVRLRAASEDADVVHLVMELCEGGELFDRIVARGHYSERAATAVAHTLAEVVRTCRLHGVMHRDLKPENYLFANKRENSPLKGSDFLRLWGVGTIWRRRNQKIGFLLSNLNRVVFAGKYMPGEVVAVRVPLLHLTNFQINDWPELSTTRYALLVLMLPSDSARQWHVHELELVEVVADQVAVALSHAAILEESMRARDLLLEQNAALDLARREAETAIRARNDFLAVMNHEMRTPMHAILALSSLLQESQLSANQRMMVEAILKSSNLLATLINDVLDLSRLEDGSLELKLDIFKIPAVFKEVLSLIKPIASVKKISVSSNLAPELPEYAVGDKKRLMQIILNIVGNAVKFSKEGNITISASIAGPEALRDATSSEFRPAPSDNHFYLLVQVKDAGSGLSAQDIPKLFNKFSQSHSLASKDCSGSGLGLAICKRFVSLMDGHIWIESDGPGKGCTAVFFVKLGIAEYSNEFQNYMVSKGQSCNRQTHFPGLKVLIVDDNGVSRTVTKGLLTHLGCEVTVVSSGNECLRVISQQNFRVVFMDVGSTTGMDTYEVVVRVQERFPVRRERPFLVALTGTTDRITRETCLKVGMDGVLLKPVSLDRMRAVLAELMEQGSLSEIC